MCIQDIFFIDRRTVNIVALVSLCASGMIGSYPPLHSEIGAIKS